MSSTHALHIDLKPASRWPATIRLLLGAALLPLPWMLPTGWGLGALLLGSAGLLGTGWIAARSPQPTSLRLLIDSGADAPGAALVQSVVMGRALFLRSATQALALWPDQLTSAQAAQLRAWLKQHDARHAVRLVCA